MTELSGYAFSALRGGEFTLYRGSGDGLDPILLVAPIGEYSARGSPSSGSNMNMTSRPNWMPGGLSGR